MRSLILVVLFMGFSSALWAQYDGQDITTEVVSEYIREEGVRPQQEVREVGDVERLEEQEFASGSLRETRQEVEEIALPSFDFGNSDYLYNIDIRDIRKYGKSEDTKHLANTIVAAFRTRDRELRALLMPSGVNFLHAGAHRLTGPIQGEELYEVKTDRSKNTVYGVEIIDIAQDNDYYSIRLQALIHSDDSGYFFRFYEIAYLGLPLNIQSIQVLKDIPLSLFKFDIKVGVAQHKMIVMGEAIFEGELVKVKKVYPIAVGALDNDGDHNSRYRSLTPLYKQHRLRRSAARLERNDPWYFRAMPFMLITLNRDLYTQAESSLQVDALRARSGVGFHRIMNSDRVTLENGRIDYVPTLHRGYDSHGCVRLQIKDLYEFYFLLDSGARSYMNLNMSQYLSDNNDSPFPLYVDLENKVKRVFYGRAQRSVFRAHRLVVGRKVEVELEGVLQEVVIHDVEGDEVIYKKQDEFGLDALESVSPAKLRENMDYTHDIYSSDFSDIMQSEMQIQQWLYFNRIPRAIRDEIERNLF